ncbi:MAG: Rieske 2Fe-2S domain-containing protein [Rhodovibrionaceae bacterium]|nr:Rieske 2Fe-2S domain-containing protein [Rhodovibrionaceae bacterium]
MRILCRLQDIDDGEARGFELGEGTARRSIFVVRDGEAVYGYENSCPHLGTPLEFLPDDFMSEDGSHIVCATHGALFQIHDGYCVAGPCAGDCLTPVDLRLDDQRRVVLPENGGT